MPSHRRKTKKRLTYKASGVDIASGDRFVDRIQRAMRRTYDPRVLSKNGAFAGLLRLDFAEKLLRRGLSDPVLVAGADGVGSKLFVALEHDRLDTIGIDLVAMNVNDVLTTGAEPLFFLDYIACHKLEPSRIARIVEGISAGCRQAGCALLGGETAEMPALYAPTHFDLAGFCVGVIEQRRIIDGHDISPGDAVIGLASNGLHSNGFSLVREALKRLPKKRRSPKAGRGESSPPKAERPRQPREAQNRRFSEASTITIGLHQELLGEPLADALLRPTRIYVRPILDLLARYRRKRVVRAMAHITGGGLPGNVPRVIPENCDVVLSRNSWPVPPIFRLIQQAGVTKKEMYRVFNMGIGFVLIVRPAFAAGVMNHLLKAGEIPYRIGRIRRGSGKLVWQ